MRAISGPRPAKYEVAGGVQQRNTNRDDLRAIAIGRDLRQFGLRKGAFHRGKPALSRDQMPAYADESCELGEGARDHYVEAPRRLPSLGAPFVHDDIRQRELDGGLAQEGGLLAARFVQGDLPLRACDRDGKAGCAASRSDVREQLGGR
jgi:hypothetical protein